MWRMHEQSTISNVEGTPMFSLNVHLNPGATETVWESEL